MIDEDDPPLLLLTVVVGDDLLLIVFSLIDFVEWVVFEEIDDDNVEWVFVYWVGVTE